MSEGVPSSVPSPRGTLPVAEPLGVEILPKSISLSGSSTSDTKPKSSEPGLLPAATMAVYPGVNNGGSSGGGTTIPLGGDMHSRRSFIFRRTVILLLLVAVQYLALVGWKPNLPIEVPIRGGVGMRPLGEVCYLDPITNQKYTIYNRHAIVFDAGSTGSRVHVYEFQYCGPRLTVLVDEVFEEVKPGLSHYHFDPPQAAHSLGPLLESAVARVPPITRKCTPLVVKATAGLRLLPEMAVTSILSQVRQFIATHPFPLGGAEAVAVMDGSEEGVFAWATVNFLLDKLRPGLIPTAAPFLPDETSVVMDLGGGSTQIVFAIGATSSEEFDPLKYPQYYYRLSLHGREMDLYQQSYLGYGLMEARKNIKMTHIARMVADTIERKTLRFPCFPKGYRERVTGRNGSNYTLVGDGAGWDACLGVVGSIFRKEEPCTLYPCSFNGIHQPRIVSKSLIAFSYFFDRLIPLGLTSPVTLFDIDREGRRLCSPTKDSRYNRLLEENPQWCLDLTFIHMLLRVGYSIDLDQPIVVTKQINGYEAGWSLGAALKLLESAPPCDESSSKK